MLIEELVAYGRARRGLNARADSIHGRSAAGSFSAHRGITKRACRSWQTSRATPPPPKVSIAAGAHMLTEWPELANAGGCQDTAVGAAASQPRRAFMGAGYYRQLCRPDMIYKSWQHFAECVSIYPDHQSFLDGDTVVHLTHVRNHARE